MNTVAAMNNFRAHLYRMVQNREATVTSLAEDCGLSRPYMSKLVNGHQDCGIETAEKIAHALGYELEEMLSSQLPEKTRKTA